MDKAEAQKLCLEYFNGDELATEVYWKYALHNNIGDILEPTPDLMHKRIAKELARIEAKYTNPMSEDEIFNLIDRFKYIVPQGSLMAGIGNKQTYTSLANCVVIDSPLDSYGSILRADESLAQLYKRRCGVGVDISNIRPKGLSTMNASKTTDGIGCYMERFSNTTREVAQQGRRGALMLTISIHHPEIESFIDIKKDRMKVTGANISIRISDTFMNAVEQDTTYTQEFPIGASNPLIRREVRARSIWDKIIEAAWDSAEPGVLFWDKIVNYTPTASYEGWNPISTNPCSEIPLNVDSCRLLLINTFSYVKDAFSPNAEFDYTLFAQHVMKAMRLMDDVVDLDIEHIDRILAKVESDPEPDNQKRTEREIWQRLRDSAVQGRRTGLGITGLGDTLAALGITYGSKEAVQATRGIYKNLAGFAYCSSYELADERGAFPIFDYEKEKENVFVTKIQAQIEETKGLQKYTPLFKKGRRNIAILTTAPAGSVSVLTQTTSGIEPAFMLKYTRRRKVSAGTGEVDFIDPLGDRWREFDVYHPKFKMWCDLYGKETIEDSPYHKATANEIDYLESIEMQAAAQEWIDHAISKTTNLSSYVSKELVSSLYMQAWKKGCKGFTVYRAGCRTGVLIAKEDKKREATKRPDILECDIHHSKIGGENWIIFVGKLDGVPYEVMGGLSKYIDIPTSCRTAMIRKVRLTKDNSRYDLMFSSEGPIIQDLGRAFENPLYESFTRTISLSIRHKIPVQFICEQLQKGDKSSDIYSFSKVISRVLKKYIKEGTKSSSDKECPGCKQEGLIYQEGCLVCSNCGFSKCG